MNRAAGALAAVAAALALSPAPAEAHRVEGFLSPTGLEFVERQLPALLPTRLFPPEFAQNILCVEAVQRQTVLDLEFRSARIDIPREGSMVIELSLGASAEGELFVDKPYLCLGSATCRDRIDIAEGFARVEFSIVRLGGRLQVDVVRVDLDVSHEDVEVTITDCAIDGLLTELAGFTRRWITGFLVDKIAELAEDKIAPMIEEAVSMLADFRGTVGIADLEVALTGLSMSSGGISVEADIDLTSRFPVHRCVGADPGEPGEHPGDPPSLAGGPPTHLGLSFNLGLIDDFLYHAWARGLTCLTDDHFEALGLGLSLDEVTGLLPGFPPGSEVRLSLRLTQPPRVRGQVSADLAMTLLLAGVVVEVTGRMGDGRENTLRVELDAEATAQVGLDPGSGAIGLRLLDAAIRRLSVADEVGAAEFGFDVARLRRSIEELLLPALFEEIGDLPITGSVFVLDRFALILRQLRTTSAFLTVHADLFRVPDSDDSPPRTEIMSTPSNWVGPQDAWVHVTGTDAEIPSELLRFEFEVDGETHPPTFVRKLRVGKRGHTGTYRVRARAVDLHGNVDPTPPEVQLRVDGIAPKLAILGNRVRRTEPGSVQIAWRALDDLTPPEALRPRVQVYRVGDPGAELASALDRVIELPPGASEVEVSVESGLYRIEIEVADLVGNEAVSSVLVRVRGGGCASAGGAPGPAPTIAVLLALAALARRRRSSPAPQRVMFTSKIPSPEVAVPDTEMLPGTRTTVSPPPG